MKCIRSAAAKLRVLYNNYKASVTLDNEVKECEKAFAMWSDIEKLGGMDPYHEDGYLLNMMRNEILSLQQRILRICKSRCCMAPDIALVPLPPVMDTNYMARGKEYSKKAVALLEEMTTSPIYQEYLVKNRNLSELGKEKLEPFTWVINQLKQGVEQQSPIIQQRALANGLMTADSALPSGAGRFLEKLALILESLDNEDYSDQMSLF